MQAHLPRNAVLVGLNIRQDVQWLSLREGEDFRSMVDIAGLYRCGFHTTFHTTVENTASRMLP